MSKIQSSSEHLTLNADGASKDIKFQANGVEKASISSAGAFTSTTIDATALTGALPAISGASLTSVTATSVDLGNWTVTESAGVLYFATGSVNKMKVDASGNLTVVGNVTAYGSI